MSVNICKVYDCLKLDLMATTRIICAGKADFSSQCADPVLKRAEARFDTSIVFCSDNPLLRPIAPAFLGLREDKAPTEVVREVAITH
jgi:hypothetical protein